MTLPIETERLVLRRYTHRDVPDILDLVSHSSVAGAVPEIEPTESGVIEYIDLQNSFRPFEQDKCFDLAIEQAGRVIGLLTLVRRKHRLGELGYALHIAYRGRGYATEAARALVAYAFTSLDLHRVQATTSSHNSGSWRVMERLGMVREGWLKEATIQDGQWMDVFIYGILAREWPGANVMDGPAQA